MKTRRRALPAPPHDINALVCFLLQDLASIQTVKQKKSAYERAGFAVFGLDEPLASLWTNGALRQPIPGVGPSSTKVIREVIETGASPLVEQAVDAAGKRALVEAQRSGRATFLSRAMVKRILADESLDGPTLADYRGDLQMHSEWSDGSMTLTGLVEACAARGYTYSAVTDHSFGLPIAGGMSMSDVQAQHAEIDRLNDGAQTFHLLKGIEANIDADGVLDVKAGQARQFDIVLAAPHAKLRPVDDQTVRLLRAVAEPHAHILAHPRGRRAGRAGLVADWARVFERAAELEVAVEIDGDPARQDLDYHLASMALDAGCVFALDSDAHSPRELIYAETALAHARLAGVPKERILNCWDLERLRDWLARRPRRPAISTRS